MKKNLLLTFVTCAFFITVAQLVVSPEASAHGAHSIGMWSPTGNMSTPRASYTATILPNGKVLVAGGQNSFGILASAELYDPHTGKWSPTGSMSTSRTYHTATLLSNGKVLITGGNSGLMSAELYDPHTGTWSPTGNMSIARTAHTATLLPNGKVLVAGSFDFGRDSSAFATAELYDPSTGTWSPTGRMSAPRGLHTATLLYDGKVLVAGGGYPSYNGYYTYQIATAELYDPNTGTWSLTGSMSTPRAYHTATLLSNGKVLVASGKSAELYDPETGTWLPTGSMSNAHFFHASTLLHNGKVLVTGGKDYSIGPVIPYINGPLAPSELYDPRTGTWSLTRNMSNAHTSHTATLLHNGKVLVAGGYNSTSNDPIMQAELYSV